MLDQGAVLWEHIQVRGRLKALGLGWEYILRALHKDSALLLLRTFHIIHSIDYKRIQLIFVGFEFLKFSFYRVLEKRPISLSIAFGEQT